MSSLSNTCKSAVAIDVNSIENSLKRYFEIYKLKIQNKFKLTNFINKHVPSMHYFIHMDHVKKMCIYFLHRHQFEHANHDCILFLQIYGLGQSFHSIMMEILLDNHQLLLMQVVPDHATGWMLAKKKKPPDLNHDETKL
jgi:hypothetical protein